MSIELGNIVSIAKGKKHDNVFPSNGIGKKRYIQIEDLRNDDNLKYTDDTGVDVSENDMIIAWDGANAGTIGFGLNGFIGSTLARLRFKEKGFDTNYLGWFLRSKSDFLRSKCTGATIPHINKSVLESLKIPKIDLKTQQEIAQLLEQADKARQQRKAANALTDQFLQSSFLFLFGDPVKNEKGWEVKKIRDFTPSILSGKSVESESRLKVKNEYGVLKVSAVTYGVFKPEEHKAIVNGYVPDKKITPKKGDILFSRANTKELVAATCIVDKDYPDLFLPDKLWKMNIDRTIVNEWFFKFVLSHQSYRNKLSEKSTGTSGSMFNISKEKLVDFNFPVPPLSLQQQFAGIVAQAEQLRQKQRESEKELENLFQGLLQRYFG